MKPQYVKPITYIPIDDLFSMIEEYGPRLRPQFSRSNFDIYKMNNMERINSEQQRMNLYMDHFGQIVPTKKAIEELAKYLQNDVVIEVNPGLGLLSYLLQQKRVDIKPIIDQAVLSGQPFTQLQLLSYITAFEQNPDVSSLLFNINDSYNNLYDILQYFPGDSIVLVGDQIIAGDIIEKLSGNLFFYRTTTGQKNIVNKWTSRKEINLPQWLDKTNKIYILEKL